MLPHASLHGPPVYYMEIEKRHPLTQYIAPSVRGGEPQAVYFALRSPIIRTGWGGACRIAAPTPPRRRTQRDSN